MKITKDERDIIINKKNILENARTNLKLDFVGLDDIIDELIENIESWYLFPEGQVRPTVINLWGLTGVGKTSLIQSLFKYLEMSDIIYKFNVGDYTDSSSDKMSNVFSGDMKTKVNKPVGIIFDEFQLGRTINEQGVEIKQGGLRVIWDLLDCGKVELLDVDYGAFQVMKLISLLREANDEGVVVENGYVTKNLDKYKEIFNGVSLSDMGILFSNQPVPTEDKKEVKKTFAISAGYISNMISCIEEFDSSRSIYKEYSKSSLTDIIMSLEEKIKTVYKPKIFDYTQACIFVIGNLDEAYSMTSNVSTDLSADAFYKNSLNINITGIKKSLKRRFRVEQIARLGNNHIIYPAFSSKIYEDLIKLELNRIKKLAKDKFELKLIFDSSLNTILYKEGVFPTHGTRPVFTTINTMVSSTLSKIAKDIVVEDKEVTKVLWSFINNKVDGKHIVRFYNKREFLFEKEYKAILKLEPIRKTTKTETQLSIAVHESGHAVSSIVNMGIIPNTVVSSGSDNNIGFCNSTLPNLKLKAWYKDDIIVSLSGMVAEKLIFGDDLLSDGCGSDLERATGNAIKAAQQFGMFDEQLIIGIPDSKTQYRAYKNYSSSDEAAKSWIDECYTESEKTIKEHKPLLLKLSKYLSENSFIKKEGIIEILKELDYDLDKIKEPESYYDLHNKFEKHFKNTEVKHLEH